MDRISGWKLFSVRGVAIRLHASLLFLLFYVFLVSLIQFPLVVAQSGRELSAIVGPPWLWSILFSIALIISILLHELGHVFVAQSLGAKVRSITLLMLGGVSQLEKFPERKYGEFKVAIVGPLVSLALGGILFLIHERSGNPSFSFFAFWIAQLNFALAIFNLLPAFPTDGGRILRSVLAERYGKIRGTRMAVNVSNVFVWIFAILGIFQFNILLFLIAFFLFGAGRTELFFAIAQSVLQEIKAKDVGTRLPVVPESGNLSDAISLMIKSRALVLPTSATKAPFGILTAECIRNIPRNDWDSIRVKDIRIEVPKSIGMEASLNNIFDLLSTSPVAAIPLLEGDQVIGLVQQQDVAVVTELLAMKAKKSPLAGSRLSGYRPNYLGS